MITLPGVFVFVKKEKILKLAVVFLLLFGFIEPFLFPEQSEAAFTYVEYRPDRMTAATLPSGSVCVKTGTAGTETSMTIVFPSSYTIDTTTANWNLDTSATNIPDDGTQWPSTTSGAATAANNGTKAVTFTVGDLSSGTTKYCLHFTASGGTSVSGSAANDLTGTIATNIDSAKSYGVSLVSSGSDQISVTATVPSTFTYSLTNTAVNLNLVTSSVTSSGGNALSISTNANNGWQAWMKSANGALNSASTSDTISAGTYTTGSGNVKDLSSTTGYVIDVTSGSGSPSIDAAFNGNSTSGGVPSTNSVIVASKGTPGAADGITFIVRAKPTATNKAATDYTDTLTITAAGVF